jgi:hypothetical protein
VLPQPCHGPAVKAPLASPSLKCGSNLREGPFIFQGWHHVENTTTPSPSESHFRIATRCALLQTSVDCVSRWIDPSAGHSSIGSWRGEASAAARLPSSCRRPRPKKRGIGIRHVIACLKSHRTQHIIRRCSRALSAIFSPGALFPQVCGQSLLQGRNYERGQEPTGYVRAEGGDESPRSRAFSWDTSK